MLKVFGIILVLAIAFGYIRMMLYIHRKSKNESRVARFKVGGQKFGDITQKEESTEDRQRRKQVSLREGPRLGRRFRGR